MNLKRMPLVLALAVVLVVASLGWIVPLSRDGQAAPAPSSDAAFKGKVLFVQMDNTVMMSGFLLEKAQAQKIGDQSFLVGKGMGEGPMGAWYKGRTVRLQMGHIVSITECEDLKDAKKVLESTGGMIGGGMAAPPYPGRPPVEIPSAPPTDRATPAPLPGGR